MRPRSSRCLRTQPLFSQLDQVYLSFAKHESSRDNGRTSRERRRLANAHDDSQVPKPESVPKNTSYVHGGELGPPLSVTQQPYHFDTKDSWGSNGFTVPSINNDNSYLLNTQYNFLQPSTSWRGIPTEYSDGIRHDWQTLQVGPNLGSSFHGAETAHINSADVTPLWSQLNTSQSTHAIPNTFGFGEAASYFSCFQNGPSALQDTFWNPGPNVPEHLGAYPNCSEYAQVQSQALSDDLIPEKETVCFGMVRKSEHAQL